MAEIENVAGRLYAILSDFQSAVDGSVSEAWAAIFEVSESEIYVPLGEVGRLLAETRKAARETGSPAWASMDEHLSALSRCVFPVDMRFNGPVNDLRPNPSSMQMLGALSYALQREAPDGRLPHPDEVEQLRESVSSLVADVAASSISPEIQRALLGRLSEMLEALSHLKLRGPDAVRKAAEALACSALLYEDGSDETHTILQRAKNLARRSWLAFTISTAIAHGLLGTWDRIVDIPAIGPGTEQPLLPAGPPVDRCEQPAGS